MSIPEITVLKSGARLELHVAPFSSGMKLFKTVVRELRGVELGISVDLAALGNLAALGGTDLPIDAMKNVVCQIIGSDAVEAALIECAGRCLYNGQKITLESFEPENARPDYLPVAWEVMKINLLPFFKGLDFKSSTKGPEAGSSPK